MSLDALKAAIPEYAKDLRLNLSSLASDETLSAVQRAGCFIATAMASGDAQTLSAIHAAFAPHLNAAQLDAVKTSASLMAMNNIYYRFTHLASNHDYATLRAGLRMNGLASHGAEKVDFELWALAVSAVNGCGLCIDSHEKVLREHGLSATQIQMAAKIAAIVFAVARTIAAENILQNGVQNLAQQASAA